MLERRPQTLSGGQRQRVALGRAIVRQPAVFLLDEPLSSLDAPLRASVRADLIDLHRRLGSTMIYVTHDQAEALAMGDRVAVMERGRHRAGRDPSGRLRAGRRPGSWRGFVGNPPMNFLPGVVLERDGSLAIDLIEGVGVETAIPVPGGRWAAILAERKGMRAELGLRPEHVVLSLDGHLERLSHESGPSKIAQSSSALTRLPGEAEVVRIEFLGTRVGRDPRRRPLDLDGPPARFELRSGAVDSLRGGPRSRPRLAGSIPETGAALRACRGRCCELAWSDARAARHFVRPSDCDGSSPMRDLLRHLTDALERGRELIVCQVVETRGSTPQKAGALMLVDPDGGQVGTLGGGCVEAEVKQKAIRRIGHDGRRGPRVRPRPRLRLGRRPDLRRQDGDPHRGPPRAPGRSPTSGPTARCSRPATGFTEAVVVDPDRLGAGVPVGARFLFDADGELVAGWPGRRLPEGLVERIDCRWPTGPGRACAAGSRFLPTLPRVRLVIVGAGHVGQAVAGAGGAGRFRRLGRRRPPAVRQRRAVPDRRAADRRADRRGARRRSRSRRRPTP